jgi:tRNA A-37 threonylcarbamoyl transferase component Bud32
MSHTTPSLTQVTLDTPMPLRLDIDGEPLMCDALLRVVPGARLVCRATWRGQTVLAKLFVHPRRASGHAQRERAGLEALAAADIACPHVVGQHTLPGGGTALLLEFLHDAAPLPPLHTVPAEEQQRLFESFFELLAHMHAHGLLQRDLHIDNVLRQGDRLIAIDTGSLTVHRKPISRRQVMGNLTIFYSLMHRSCDPQLQAALSAYNRVYPAVQPDHEQLVAAGLRHRRRLWPRRRRKLKRTCTAIVAQRSAGRRTLCKRDHNTDAMQAFLANPDAMIDSPQAEILKRGNSATVVTLALGNQRYLVKRFNQKVWHRHLGWPVHRSRVWSNWFFSHRLWLYGLATPESIALLDTRIGPLGLLRGKGYIVQELLEGQELPDAVAVAPPEEASRLIAEARQMIDLLHAHRLTHGDCKASNFLCTESGVQFIDLDSMRARGRIPILSERLHLRRVRKDLARFARNNLG